MKKSKYIKTSHFSFLCNDYVYHILTTQEERSSWWFNPIVEETYSVEVRLKNGAWLRRSGMNNRGAQELYDLISKQLC